MAALQSNERPVSLDIARIMSRIRAIAAENVEGKLDDETYVVRKRELVTEIAALGRSARLGIDAGRAVEWLKALSETWQAGGIREEKADLR